MPSAKAAAVRAAKREREALRARQEAPCDRCGGRCNDPAADLGPDECRYMEDARILAMYDARPLDAPMPDEIDPDNVEAVEDAQLAAFEAGDDEWWLVGAPVTVAGDAGRALGLVAGASGGVHGGTV